MILYIEEELKIAIDTEDFDNNDNILRECSIRYKVQDNFVIIEEQKVTLDEFKMNELFDDGLAGFSIKYGYYGGAGCDFSIRIFARPE
jgi:hypothetical protein